MRPLVMLVQYLLYTPPTFLFRYPYSVSLFSGLLMNRLLKYPKAQRYMNNFQLVEEEKGSMISGRKLIHLRIHK